MADKPQHPPTIELDGARLRPLHVADAAAHYAYLRDPVDRVHAFVRVDNRRSERLLERSGCVREGCLRSFRVCRGQPHDFYVYGLLRSD